MIPSLELPSSIDTFIVFFTPRNYLLHSRIFYIIVLTVLINGLKFAEFDKKKIGLLIAPDSMFFPSSFYSFGTT